MDVAVLAEPGPRRKRVTRARLREDVVARRVLRDLEGAVRPHVPNGKTLIVTLGAPIKVAKKLVAVLTNLLLGYLERGVQDIDEKRTILGNRVRFRVFETDTQWKVGVVGFVFTGDPAPSRLADAILALHGEIGARAKRRRPGRFAGERWLLLVSDDWIGDIRTLRRAYSVLPPQPGFRRTWMVEGGRVFALAES